MTDKKATRAVLYARVSTALQERDGVSLDAQLEMARRFCEYRGIDLVHVYRDVESGRSDRRPELAKLEAAIASHQFDAVIVYKMDRLSRDATHYHNLLQRFREHDVRLASLTQDIDATTTLGKFIMNILIAAAEMESDQTGDRVRDSYKHRAQAGRPLMCGNPSIGYRYVRRSINEVGERVPGHIEVDVEGAAIVAWLYERFIETENLQRVADEAADLGFKMPSGKPITRQSVRHILQNPHYRGEYVALKSKTERVGTKKRKVRLPPEEWVRGGRTMPAIVDDATWERAQVLLDANSAMAPRAVASRAVYPWSGLLVCAGCGSKLHRASAPGNPKVGRKHTYYYICRQNQNHGAGSCPVGARVAVEFLDRRLWPAVVAALDPIVTSEHQGRAPQPGRSKAPPRTVEKELAALRARRARVQAAFEDGDYGEDLATARRIKREKLAEIDASIKALEEASKAPREAPAPPKLVNGLADAWGRLERDPAMRGKLLRMLIHAVAVADGKLTAQFVDTNHPAWPRDIEVAITSMNPLHARNRDLA